MWGILGRKYLKNIPQFWDMSEKDKKNALKLEGKKKCVQVHRKIKQIIRQRVVKVVEDVHKNVNNYKYKILWERSTKKNQKNYIGQEQIERGRALICIFVKVQLIG